jgi:hypothetical protein
MNLATRIKRLKSELRRHLTESGFGTVLAADEV